MTGPAFLLDNANSIFGWMSGPDLIWLARIAKERKVIVEFGCYQGRSTRALADNTSGIVYAVDPWDGEYFNNDGSKKQDIDTNCYEIFDKNLSDVIQSGKVIPVRKKSFEFIPDKPADFVFIDADHRYEAVKRDILHAIQISEPGAVISGHDYIYQDWPGVKKAVDEIFNKIKLVDAIWWTIV